MTEAEAKTKWCPFVVIRDAGAPAAVNRLSNRDDQCRCVGTGCACWRGSTSQGWCGLAGRDPAP